MYVYFSLGISYSKLFKEGSIIMAYILLASSIVLEVFGTTMLKLSNGFSRKLPILGVIVGFGACFYLFSLALLDIPLGFAYALWSGIGTIFTTVIGVAFFKERINRKGMLGILLLLVGIVLLNVTK